MVLGLQREKSASRKTCRAAAPSAAARDDAWCARFPLSRCARTGPTRFPAPKGGSPTLSRAASEGAGMTGRPATPCAGAVPRLTFRATVAVIRLWEQGRGVQGNPPRRLSLESKTRFFPRRKEMGLDMSSLRPAIRQEYGLYPKGQAPHRCAQKVNCRKRPTDCHASVRTGSQ